jgi:NADH-quinone oxidoreductase subunit J
VYVGGIVVLIIFSLFLTQQAGREMPRPPVLRTIASILAVLFGFALSYFLIYKNDFKTGNKPFDWSVKKIGTQMLETGENGYALPFEVVTILLLAAMVGCIVIAIKTPAPSRPSPQGKATSTHEPTNLEIQMDDEKVE